MSENRDSSRSVLRRRFKVILIPALLASLGGFLISYAFTARYTSRAIILMRDQKMPEGHLKTAISEDLRQHVLTTEQKVLTRNRLEPMIERVGLLRSGNTLDNAVDNIQKNTGLQSAMIELSLTGNARQGAPGQADSVPGFYLSFTAPSPRLAQKICGELSSMILEETLKSLPQVAPSATTSVSRELEDAQRNLDDQDSRLAAFKKQYKGQIPGDADPNSKMLIGLNSQLNATKQTINRAEQDKAYTESLLAQQIAAWNPSQTSTNAVLAEANSGSVQATAADNKVNPNEPPQIRQLRLQVHQYQEVIAQSAREQKRLQDKIKLSGGHRARTPGVDEQYNQLTRDYDNAQKLYQDLLAKKASSEMETDTPRQEQEEDVTLLEPANFPDSPSFPNRALFAGGGLGSGLLLGFGLALWLEMRDKAMLTEQDVAVALSAPMLVSVPWVGSPASDGNDSRLQKRNKDGSSEKKETETIGV